MSKLINIINEEINNLLFEDFKSQKERYLKQGYDENIVNDYLIKFKEIKNKNYKQLYGDIANLNIPSNSRNNIDIYKDFKDLETVVDYVLGQVDVSGTSLGSELEIDGKPLYNNEIVDIYYADSARACVKYKGNIPYSWCVARTDSSSNMYNTYRYKEHEPSFYFVKIKDRTKKELGFFNMVGNVFSGTFKDKYHFFVVQTLKNANVDNTQQKQYIVTSANNDGDVNMSWNDILKIEPRLNGLQKIFKPIPLSDEDKKYYNLFIHGISNEEYCKLDYALKRKYIDVYVRMNKPISDIQFNCSPDDIKNLYIGLGIGLSDNQFEQIKNNGNALKRYKQITERMIEEYFKNPNRYILFKPSQLSILDEKYRQNFLNNITGDYAYYLLTNSKDINEMANILGKENFNKLSDDNISDLAYDYSERKNIINLILKYKNDNLTDRNVITLLRYTDNIEQMSDYIIKIKGDNLTDANVYSLLMFAKDINQMANILGKENINKLSGENVYNTINYKQLVPNEDLVNILGKVNINKLSGENIVLLLNHMKNKEQFIKILGIENINKLNDDDIDNLSIESGNMINKLKNEYYN